MAFVNVQMRYQRYYAGDAGFDDLWLRELRADTQAEDAEYGESTEAMRCRGEFDALTQRRFRRTWIHWGTAVYAHLPVRPELTTVFDAEGLDRLGPYRTAKWRLWCLDRVHWAWRARVRARSVAAVIALLARSTDVPDDVLRIVSRFAQVNRLGL